MDYPSRQLGQPSGLEGRALACWFIRRGFDSRSGLIFFPIFIVFSLFDSSFLSNRGCFLDYFKIRLFTKTIFSFFIFSFFHCLSFVVYEVSTLNLIGFAMVKVVFQPNLSFTNFGEDFQKRPSTPGSFNTTAFP